MKKNPKVVKMKLVLNVNHKLDYDVELYHDMLIKLGYKSDLRHSHNSSNIYSNAPKNICDGVNKLVMESMLDPQDQQLENVLKKQFTLHETSDIVSFIQQYHDYSKKLSKTDDNTENDFSDYIKSINNKSLTKEDALETIIHTHEKKIENLKQVLDWFNSFVDAIQTWDHKLYNNACKYADEVEEGCI